MKFDELESHSRGREVESSVSDLRGSIDVFVIETVHVCIFAVECICDDDGLSSNLRFMMMKSSPEHCLHHRGHCVGT